MLVIGRIELNGNVMRGKKKKEKYVCKFCLCNDRENFTPGTLYECRSCRAKRSKDVNFEKFSAAMRNQKLADKYWKATA